MDYDQYYRLRRGNVKTFRELYSMELRRMWFICYHITRDVSKAAPLLLSGWKKAMEQIQMIYGSCIRAISGNVDMDIKELMRQKEDIMQLDEKMRKNHIARVGKGKCDSKLTIPFNDVLHNIDRIGNSCVNLVEVAKENVTMQAFFAED